MELENELRSKEMEEEERPCTISTVDVRGKDKLFVIFNMGE